MRKNIITYTIILLTIAANSQNSLNILIGKKEKIYSNLLKENRNIFIYTPTYTSNDTSGNKRYPVIYILDGDAHFLSTVGIVQQLSQANVNGVLPEMIVVGIENTNRLRDLTPVLNASQNKDHVNNFVNFISSELMPYIEKNYNTAPYKILIGHSLGGLTAVNILTTFPKLFNAYIAIDPSMWYEKEEFLKQTMTQLPKENLKGTRLFIGIANSLPKGMSLTKLNKDKSTETQHIRSIFKLDKFLKLTSNGLKYAQKYYDSENHNSVPLISTYDGLKFIFDYYKLDATEKDFSDTTNLIATKLKNHYEKVSSEMGYKISAPEAFVNYFGYDALNKKQYSKAQAMFQLNVESYPNSSNVYDSYGDYFALRNDTINAIINYKKANTIKNDTTVLNKISVLSKPHTFTISLEDLHKYTGTYTLQGFNIDVTLDIINGKLFSKMAGRANSEFVPVSKNVFTVKGTKGYTITFEMNGDKPTGFISVQPDGTYIAEFKN